MVKVAGLYKLWKGNIYEKIDGMKPFFSVHMIYDLSRSYFFSNIIMITAIQHTKIKL